MPREGNHTMRALLFRLCELTARKGAELQPGEESIKVEGMVITLSIAPAEATSPAFRGRKADILRAASSEPQTAKQLARKSGWPYNPGFRQDVAYLKSQGLLIKTPTGLVLSDRTNLS